MANLGQAFSRIMPRYEFHPNQGVMYVEDLENTLGRVNTVGYPARRICPYHKPAAGHYPHPCYRMQRCNSTCYATLP